MIEGAGPRGRAEWSGGVERGMSGCSGEMGMFV